MCSLHSSTHNSRKNLPVKALLDAGSNLPIMHCNTCNFNKSTSHPLLTTTNPQHLDINCEVCKLQLVLLEAQVVEHQHLTFLTNKTTFFFNDWTQKNLNTKNKDIRQTFKKLFKLSKTERQNDIKLTFATKKCQYIWQPYLNRTLRSHQAMKPSWFFCKQDKVNALSSSRNKIKPISPNLLNNKS
jgi:hypothetical protein